MQKQSLCSKQEKPAREVQVFRMNNERELRCSPYLCFFRKNMFVKFLVQKCLLTMQALWHIALSLSSQECLQEHEPMRQSLRNSIHYFFNTLKLNVLHPINPFPSMASTMPMNSVLISDAAKETSATPLLSVITSGCH